MTDEMFARLKAKKASGEEITSEEMDAFTEQREKLEEREEQVGHTLEYAFRFMEQAFSNREEMVVFVTELTVHPASALYLSENECELYEKYRAELLIGSRKQQLLQELTRG